MIFYACGEFDVSQLQRVFRDDDVTYIGYPADDKNGTMVQTGGTTLVLLSLNTSTFYEV